MEYAKVIVIRLLPIDPSDFDLALWKWSMLQISSLDPFPGTGDHCSPIGRGAQSPLLTSDGKIQVFVEQQFVTIILWITSRKFLRYLLS